MIIRTTNSQSSKYSYNNILDTVSDLQTQKKENTQTQISDEEILKRNFQVLEEIIKTFTAEYNTELAMSSQFKQQWQNHRKEKYQFKYSYFFRQSKTYLCFNLALLLFYIVLLWLISVFRVYKCYENQFIFYFTLVLQIFDLGFKSVYLIASRLKQQNTGLYVTKPKDLIQIYIGNAYCILYSVLGIFSLISQVENLNLLLLDALVVGCILQRLDSIQNDIKMFKSSLELKSYIKIFSLMSTLILITHFFAVLMQYSTNFTQVNYLSDQLKDNERNWINLYAYSFYFSGTTVLTVGYGDILPKNIIEIFIVMLMQIFGVVMIVYLNGEVGNILCSLRREKQNMQNDISVLERLKSSYKLSLETTQRIRQYLIDNRRADQENNVQQEKALLQKISTGLREQVTLTNHINIIKQSLFLLSNFTTKAHISISNKLISRIYSPNECFNQIVGYEKLFFLKKGEVCLYITKNSDDEGCDYRKIIKTIQVGKNNKPQCNCFGYVSLIGGKQSRLKAFSKDFSDCYSIQKEQFLESINWYNQDFEKFHELRQNYITNKNPEKYEAPNFFDQKDHYACEASKIIAQYHKEKFRSKRKNRIRGSDRRRLILQASKDDSNFLTDSQSESNGGNVIKTSDTQFNSCLSLKERQRKYELYRVKALKGSATTNLVVQRKYTKRYCKKPVIKSETKIGSNKFISSSFSSEPFEKVFSYAFFYPNSNVDQVISKMNYYLQVLAIFTNVFEKALSSQTKDIDQNPANSSDNALLLSTIKIMEYRKHKNFIESISKLK